MTLTFFLNKLIYKSYLKLPSATLLQSDLAAIHSAFMQLPADGTVLGSYDGEQANNSCCNKKFSFISDSML